MRPKSIQISKNYKYYYSYQLARISEKTKHNINGYLGSSHSSHFGAKPSLVFTSLLYRDTLERCLKPFVFKCLSRKKSASQHFWT